MDSFSDESLLEAYKYAKELHLADDFISVLEGEIKKRGLFVTS